MSKQIGWKLFLLFLSGIALWFVKVPCVEAADTLTEDVNVVVPTNLQITFLEDGTTQVSDFVFENNEPYTMVVESLTVDERNSWKLVTEGSKIPVNTKKMALKMNGSSLKSGKNLVNIEIPGNTQKRVAFEVGRGAWTFEKEKQTALVFQMEYSFIGVPEAFAVYSNDDHSLRFYKRAEIPKEGDVFEDREVTSVYTGIEKSKYNSMYDMPWFGTWRKKIEKIVVEDVIKPVSTSYWFTELNYVTYIDVEKLDTSRVTDMQRMFDSAGYESVTTFEIKGMEQWDTSNVTDMSNMFRFAGLQADAWSIGDLSLWNTSKVTDMTNMFRTAGTLDSDWTIGNLENWDTSNVTSMSAMFYAVGAYSDSFSLGDLSGWNTENVTNMNSMFYRAGTESSSWFVGDLSRWDTSKVTDMYEMFYSAGEMSSDFSVGEIGVWDTSNVTSMHRMFYEAGKLTSYYLDLSTWNVENVLSHDWFDYGVELKIDEPNFE